MMRDLLSAPERARRVVNGAHSREGRSAIGQFLTPEPIARLMASLFERDVANVRILDAGAGVGVLFAAVVQNLCKRNSRPESIDVVAYENDSRLTDYLQKTMDGCRRICKRCGIVFRGELHEDDFVAASLGQLDSRLFTGGNETFTHAILNPPYKKINGKTAIRKRLDAAGMGTSNLYAAFVWLAARALAPAGELVAITPRSFCNGPYFRRCRKAVLNMMSLHRLHMFGSRNKVFADDRVLQENVIVHAVRSGRSPRLVRVSSSEGMECDPVKSRDVPFDRVVFPRDPDAFIHIPLTSEDDAVLRRMACFATTLKDLGLEVSTGRVVAFRARPYVRPRSEPGTVPLLHPSHFADGLVRWPLEDGRKPEAIIQSEATENLLVSSGFYVLTKRFSSKEEPRRLVAAVYDPGITREGWVGFENHLNYFHAQGHGMPGSLARGLAVFLNSTVCDRYFRLFSGHTQVNAMDLRKMSYPTRDQLIRLGKCVSSGFPGQQVVDALLMKECGCHEQEPQD